MDDEAVNFWEQKAKVDLFSLFIQIARERINHFNIRLSATVYARVQHELERNGPPQ